MMARISSVGPEAFSRSDRISNGLSTVMRDHMALNPSRVDMLLGLSSQPQTAPAFDANELNEEDIWGATEMRSHPEESNGSPIVDVRKFDISSFSSGGKDVISENGNDIRFMNTSSSRRWIGREKETGLSVAYADTGRSRAFPSPLNRTVALNGNGTFSTQSGASGRTASRLIPNREVKGGFSQLSSAVEKSKILQQSAPVNVPDWSKILGTERKPFYTKPFPLDDEAAENDEDEERLPPHELIAREYARSQANTFSMCEGAGRTLKGRDQSRVRNAVLRQTGFLNDQ